MSINDIRALIRDIPGAEGLTMQTLAGMERYGIGGKLISVPIGSSPQEVETAIRSAMAEPAVAQIPAGTPISASPSSSLIPNVNVNAVQPKATTMSTPAPGGFAAKIRAMMDKARSDLAQAQADGLAQVGDAVEKLNDAKVQTAAVSATMVKTIQNETAAALAELGQISNMPPE